MTNQEIETLFFTVIQEKAIYNKLEGISRNTVFNWINNRSTPTIGDMLNVLHQLKRISLIVADVAKAQKIKYENLSENEANEVFENDLKRINN